MHDTHGRNYRWYGAVGTALALLAMLQLPNTAGTPTGESILNRKIDPFYRLEQQGKPQNPNVKTYNYDAWVAKYQVGPNGVRKVLWKKQISTPTENSSWSVATDSSGNVFITGYQVSDPGGFNAWVAKYSPSGTLKWIKQLSGSGSDASSGVATDSNGNVFITGITEGSLGGTNMGLSDAWVAKFSPQGTLVWIKQLGTSWGDSSSGVATDSSGNVFITGFTGGALGGTNRGSGDAWVAKFSPQGTLMWKRQLGTLDREESNGVATDRNGNVFITGQTNGALGSIVKRGPDAWVAKYSSDGTLKWIQQLGTSRSESSRGVATDRNGNVFITGDTDDALEGTLKGEIDAWVAKFSPGGTLKWIKQLGTSKIDYSYGVATDSNGNVFVTGFTYGSLGRTNLGGADMWAAKFNPQGKQLWLRQDGTTKDDPAWGIAVDSNGYVMTTGFTYGNFSGD
ncbi:MAG TPA: SBBP repeat-containing protein [Stenomitos sp.]